jgi:hypothetical protein
VQRSTAGLVSDLLDILFSIQICGHNQAGLGAGGANELEHLVIAIQRLGSPVFGDLGEQTMLDGIPFGGAGRVVSDRNGESEGIAQPSLDFGFPGPGSATVTAARVRQNQKLGNASPATQPSRFHQVAMEWAAKAGVS